MPLLFDVFGFVRYTSLQRRNETIAVIRRVMMTETMGASGTLIVLSNIDVNDIAFEGNDRTRPVIDRDDILRDDMDLFNHPRKRRALILTALEDRRVRPVGLPDMSIVFEKVEPYDDSNCVSRFADVYKNVHVEGLLTFLATAWDRWVELDHDGRDQSGCQKKDGEITKGTNGIPPLLPCCFPLRPDPYQVPGKHVIGQAGFYNTDTVTPVFDGLLREMLGDAALVQKSVDWVTNEKSSGSVVYMIPTHPGHHASYDCFGGYCYLNHAAACADLIKSKLRSLKTSPAIAILDIDYHCGNGTASIFYRDPSVLVVSIHCDPDYEYPFYSGFATETGANDGLGTTLHLPLPPGTTWSQHYKDALEKGLAKIKEFNPDALIVSMGLDTYDKDPCAMARGGFCLKDDDYVDIGKTIAAKVAPTLPTIFIQEGGYRMEKIGVAAADVVTAFTKYRL